MANFEKAPAEVQEILSKPIQQLGLKLEGSPLDRFVQQLYNELAAKKLNRFRPKCYLTDEWGCPNMEPVIGIPFYLADPKLQQLESEMNDIEDAIRAQKPERPPPTQQPAKKSTGKKDQPKR